MMEKYEVTAPDGTVYEVEGPTGASDEEVLAQVQAYSQAAPAPRPGPFNTARAVAAPVMGAVRELQEMFDSGADRAALIEAGGGGLNEPQLDEALAYRDAGGMGASIVDRTTVVPGLPAPAPEATNDPLNIFELATAPIANFFAGDDGASGAGAFGRGLLRAALPTAVSVPAFGAGFTTGATLGTVGGPVGSLAGGIGGGLVAALGAGYAANEVQERALDQMPAVEQLLGQDDAQRSLDAQQHPRFSFAGELAPNLLFMRPGGFGRSTVREGATAVERAIANPATMPAIGATVSGGGEAARQATDDRPTDLGNLVMAIAANSSLNQPTRFIAFS